jgi:hypothetical protein
MKAQFGSISSGTMRPEDLIPEFSSVLRDLAGDDESIARLCDEADSLDFDDEDSAEDADEILNELFDRLNEHAPAYGYFGGHPGDGADYGFWLCEDFQQSMRDDDVLEVSDLSEVPFGFVGEVLHVNDHGNCSFYATNESGELAEIWSVA